VALVAAHALLADPDDGVRRATRQLTLHPR